MLRVRIEDCTIDVYQSGDVSTQRIDGRSGVYSDVTLTHYDCRVFGSLGRALGTSSTNSWYRSIGFPNVYDCLIEDYAGNGPQSAYSRGNRVHMLVGDTMQNSKCAIGNSIYDMEHGGHPDAFQFTGGEHNGIVAYNRCYDCIQQFFIDSEDTDVSRVAWVGNSYIQTTADQYRAQLGPTTATAANYKNIIIAHNTLANQRLLLRDFTTLENCFISGNAAREIPNKDGAFVGSNHALDGIDVVGGFNFSSGDGGFVGGMVYTDDYISSKSNLRLLGSSGLLAALDSSDIYLSLTMGGDTRASKGAFEEFQTTMTNPDLTTTQPQAALDIIKADCDTLNALGVGTSTITASDLTNALNTTAGEIAVQKTNQDNLNVDNALGLTLTVPIGDFLDQFQTLYDNNVAIEAVI